MGTSSKLDNSTELPRSRSISPTIQIPETTMSPHTDTENVILVGSLVLILLATLLGNALVCLTVYRRRKLRTRTNMFVVNLACADIGVALLCMPFSLVTCLNHGWILGNITCQMNGFLNILLTQTSLLTLTAISIETYFAIVKPLYHRLMGKKNFMWLLMWTWIQPSLIAAVPLTGFLAYEFKAGTTQCGVQFPSTHTEIVFGSGVVLVGFLIPLAIMGFTYINTFRSARRHTRRLSRVSTSSKSSRNSTMSHRQVAATVLILVAVFIACWTPYFVYVVLVMFDIELASNAHVMNLGKAAYWCVFSCSALNPFVYGFRNPQLRKEFRFFLCLLCPCMRRGKKSQGCSASGSKGSRDGSNFDYGYLRRVSTTCASPAIAHAHQSFDIGLLNLASKMTSNQTPNPLVRSSSSDPGYASEQEDNNNNVPRPCRVDSDESNKEFLEGGSAFLIRRGSDSHDDLRPSPSEKVSSTDLLVTSSKSERKASFRTVTRRNLKLGWIETKM